MRNERGQAVTLGLMQGKFHVWKDPATGVKLANNPFHGLPESTATKVGLQSAPTHSSAPGFLSVADLKKRVLEVRP